MPVSIQACTSDKTKEITDVFCRAMHAIDASISSEAQKQAWVPMPPNYANWLERLNQKCPVWALWRHLSAYSRRCAGLFVQGYHHDLGALGFGLAQSARV